MSGPALDEVYELRETRLEKREADLLRREADLVARIEETLTRMERAVGLSPWGEEEPTRPALRLVSKGGD